MVYRYFLILFFLCISTAAYSQNSDRTGLFYLTNISRKINDQWSVYLENQWRSLDAFKKFYYYEVKAGVTYVHDQNFSFTLGTGMYKTFAEGEEYEHYSKQFENRIWQQVNMKQNLSVIDIDHRYRVEQRFKNSYENRFRYRLKADVPLNRREIESKAIFLSAYNELFFVDRVPHFSRNRFQVGGGYVWSDAISLQIGWLRQIDFDAEFTRRKNYIYTALNIEI